MENQRRSLFTLVNVGLLRNYYGGPASKEGGNNSGTHNLQIGPRNPKQEPLLFPVMLQRH